MTSKMTTASGHVAKAKIMNIAVSAKHCIELSKYLRYRSVAYATGYLEEVVALKTAVPFPRFYHNTGHKKGQAAGRYPVKAAREFLRLMKAVHANAQAKGFDASSLKITKLLSNRAAAPNSGGRSGTGTKRTHLEIEVQEGTAKKEKKAAESRAKPEQPKTKASTTQKEAATP